MLKRDRIDWHSRLDIALRNGYLKPGDPCDSEFPPSQSFRNTVSQPQTTQIRATSFMQQTSRDSLHTSARYWVVKTCRADSCVCLGWGREEQFS